MNIGELDSELASLVKMKNELSVLNYNDENYDKIEEELHDQEDEFLKKYGDYIEDGLNDVHDEYCPDTDVLLPTAYLANKYIEKGKNEDGSIHYDVAINEGVIVEVDDYPDVIIKLVLVPGPTRLVLNVKNKGQEVVWKAK